MADTTYPTEFPLSIGLEVISLIKNRQLRSNRAKLAHHLWVLQGYAQLNLIGDPNVAILASAAEPEAISNTSDVFVFNASPDPVSILQRACDAQSPDNITSQIDIPWAQLLQWAISELLKLTVV